MSRLINTTALIFTQGAAIRFTLSRDSTKLLKEVRQAMRQDELEILWEELEALDPNTYQGLVWRITKAYIHHQ